MRVRLLWQDCVEPDRPGRKVASRAHGRKDHVKERQLRRASTIICPYKGGRCSLRRRPPCEQVVILGDTSDAHVAARWCDGADVVVHESTNAVVPGVDSDNITWDEVCAPPVPCVLPAPLVGYGPAHSAECLAGLH